MAVRHAVLGLLHERPRHGYELHAGFAAVSWDLKPAQIYTTLKRLESSGLVRQNASSKDGGPERRSFELTQAGLDELRQWFAIPVKSQHERDEFFLKLMIAIATGEVDPVTVLHTQRNSLFRELHDLTHRRHHTDPNERLAFMLLLDQGIMHIEADLRWLEMVEARLDDIKKQPLPKPPQKKRGRPTKKPR